MLVKFIDSESDKRTVELLNKSINSKGLDRRTIKLAGDSEMLDKIEQMLAYMSYLGNIGHYTEFNVVVDGDGRFRCRIKDESGKDLQKKHKDYLKDNLEKGKDIESFRFC